MKYLFYIILIKDIDSNLGICIHLNLRMKLRFVYLVLLMITLIESRRHRKRTDDEIKLD